MAIYKRTFVSVNNALYIEVFKVIIIKTCILQLNIRNFLPFLSSGFVLYENYRGFLNVDRFENVF